MAVMRQRLPRVLSALVIAGLFSGVVNSAKAGGKDESAILLHHNDYDFTQRNVNELITFGEYLARAKFSEADKQALTQWSIEDFKSAVAESIGFYQSLRNTLLPKIKASSEDEVYRANLYRGVVNNFKQRAEYAASPNNFLAIIDRYHPPREEADQLQQLYTDMVMQNMQINQMQFDQSKQPFSQST